MNNLEQQILDIIASGKAMGLSFIAKTLQVSDKEAIEALPAHMALVVDKDKFQKIWNFMTLQEHLTFITQVKNSFIEIKTQILAGKNAHGYFNLIGDAPLNGHLKLEDIAEIVLLSVPFMHLESHQIAFLDDKGQILYSFYLGRKQHKLIPSQVDAFKKLWEELSCAH